MSTVFAADIGGTKSELAVFEKAGSNIRAVCETRYQNRDFSGFDEIVTDFVRKNRGLADVCCIAVAGPVWNNRVEMTNLDWVIDGAVFQRSWDLGRVQLVNDMTALCQVLPHLAGEELFTIQRGAPGNEVCAVIAPGTGLGEGYLVNCGQKSLAVGAEGGHADFAPVSGEQRALLEWMTRKDQPVSYESLIAGPGLALLFDFLSEYYNIAPSGAVAQQLASAADRSVVIVNEVAAAGGCQLCRRTVELFLEILGGEAGNLALKVYALGGLFLGGGILPRLAGAISYDRFLAQFHNKGKMAALMARIPVHLIMTPHAVLTGAAWHGFECSP